MTGDYAGAFEATDQKAAWLARELPQVEALYDGLWSLPVPIDGSPLRYTTVYCFESRGSLVLLDAGVGGGAAWDHLVAGLQVIGAGISDVEGVIVTHFHHDHVGQAARIREESGAWIGLHPADAAVLRRFGETDLSEFARSQTAWLESLGASTGDAVSIVASLSEHFAKSLGTVPDREILDGDLIRAGAFDLRAIHTPGHTPGHLCFIDESSGSFFAGDHVLPRITPNISVIQGESANPLKDYLDSLAAVRNLEVRGVLPAHEWRFGDLAARVDELTGHHEKRLAELLTLVASHPGESAWALAARLTWSRPWDEYPGWMRVIAVTETLAHLVLLVSRDLVSVSGAPVPSFALAARRGRGC